MKRSVLIFLLTLVVAAVYAQAPSLPPPPGGGGSVAAPLDGFTWMLLLFGSGYAAKAFRNKGESE